MTLKDFLIFWLLVCSGLKVQFLMLSIISTNEQAKGVQGNCKDGMPHFSSWFTCCFGYMMSILAS